MKSKIDWQEFSKGLVFGVDEVGRGCLAGDVYAAACCFNTINEIPQGLTDSKLLSEKRRGELAPVIQRDHWVSLGVASTEEIDEINILQASLLAMKRAVLGLEKIIGKSADHLLIDGHMKIPDLAREQTTLVQGDLNCELISAAAIYAKYERDQYMIGLGKIYPEYGFEKHKGYGSVYHREAIKKNGATNVHRKSFRGVREFI